MKSFKFLNWVNNNTLVMVVFNIIRAMFYINIVLGGGALGFQFLNLINDEKAVLAPYLGKFQVVIDNPAMIETDKLVIPAMVGKLSGNPDLIVKGNLHLALVMIYTLIMVMVVLFYNYKLMQIFKALQPKFGIVPLFESQIPKYFKQLALFSLAVFLLGSILSVLKLTIITDIVIQGTIFTPVYDNGLLNFLVAGIVFWILTLVFKMGFTLKQENELTI